MSCVPGDLLTLNQLSFDFFGLSWWHYLNVLKLGVLAFKGVIVEFAFSNIEGISPEKSVDFLFKLHEFRWVKGVLEYLSREDRQCFKEVDIGALVRLNLRLELDERLVGSEGMFREWSVEEDYPTVCVGHLSCLLVKFLFLAGKDLRHRQSSEPGFLLQHLLLILEAEELLAVLQQRLQEVLIFVRTLIRVEHKLEELLWDVSVLVLWFFLHHSSHRSYFQVIVYLKFWILDRSAKRSAALRLKLTDLLREVEGRLVLLWRLICILTVS